ncbi:hypothetical protein Patl1_11175 [Pistacia atlantica]|uniref:Uncharacterized protein n=1 Tax=Pistacia atlantica TaxID=434234 RepID=A0ACC1A570_9ROSI|nr:hypothetical protein Patl1_11175 [Pistacia atlantica]
MGILGLLIFWVSGSLTYFLLTLCHFIWIMIIGFCILVYIYIYTCAYG